MKDIKVLYLISILLLIIMITQTLLFSIGKFEVSIEKTPSPGMVNPPSSQPSTITADKININTASEQLLCKLDGIGPAKAKAIIAYRKENGSFTTIEEIMQVSGIGEKSFEKIKDFICTENE